MNSPTVLIFRKRILAYSETFIVDQGSYLPHFRSCFCGFQREQSGQKLLGDLDVCLLPDYSLNTGVDKLLMRYGLGGGKQWLAQLRERNPQLMHAHFFNDGVDAVKLAARLDIPSMVTLHGHDITKRGRNGSNNQDSRRLFDRVDAVIAVSNYIAEHALRNGCPESKLIQHYIGINVEHFTQPKLESDNPSLLFVGRLVEKKGCTYLLKAMSRISDKYPGLGLTIVGDGPLKTALMNEAQALSLNVEFVGVETPDQIRHRLANCWLFTAPSITADNGDAEGLGMVFLEAQALCTPVVSFASGGIVEAVAHDSSGLLCEEKDVESLATNIDTLLADQALRKEMGRQGRLRVETQFDVKQQCAKLESIYNRLITTP